MAPYGACISLCSLYRFDMTMQTSVFIGAVIGAILSALLFICVPWYHSMIMWQFNHFWYLLPCAFIGAAVAAAATD